MGFWSARRNTRADATDGSAARALEPALQRIRLFLPDRQVEGWIVSTDDRITDLLNRKDVLRVCVDPAEDAWESADLDELLLVAPPRHDGDPQRRLHRRKHRLAALVGPYVVTGVAHVAVGVDPEAFLLRTRQSFLPMTDAHVTSRVDGTVDEAFPVVIINVGNLVELHALIPTG